MRTQQYLTEEDTRWEHRPFLREDVKSAAKALKMEKSAGVDNIPTELVQAGGEAMIDIMTSIGNKIWKTKKWSTTRTQSLVITLPKKNNLQLCQYYLTISLISHPSKVMLKVILNRLQPQAQEIIAEEIIAEEQASFRAGRSTTEPIINLRILCEKYLQHQQNLYHVFIDFKKAFNKVWHDVLWAIMRKYNINANIVRVIKSLFYKAQSVGLLNGSTGDWFRTTLHVLVRQGWLLSPTLFNIFLARVMCDALGDHEGCISIGGRLITNFWFADDIVVNAEEERSWRPCRPSWYNHHKIQNGDWFRQDESDDTQSKWLPKRDQEIGQRLETVANFKYLGAIISNEWSKSEILSRIAQTTAALSRLKSYGGTRTSGLLSMFSWCGRSSYPPSFMSVRARPWQQNSREGSKPLRWDAIGDFWTFPTETMWRTRKFATESKMQLECMMNSLPWWRNGKSDGMATSQDPLAWRRQFCRGQWKERKGEEDREEKMGR